MPVFKKGVEVTTTTPTVVVEGPVTAGTYVYQLVVEDDTNTRSTPVTTTVQVK